jgi:hypothetical protein
MEKILGSLVGVSYHTFDTVYDLLFTTERVIAFIIQHPTDIPYRSTSMLKTLFLGSVLTKGAEQSERAKITQARRRSLQEKPIDELVALHPSSFEIRYSEVTFVEITRGLSQIQLRFCASNLPTKRQIIRFTLSKEQMPDAQRLMELALASKIKRK